MALPLPVLPGKAWPLPVPMASANAVVARGVTTVEPRAMARAKHPAPAINAARRPRNRLRPIDNSFDRLSVARPVRGTCRENDRSGVLFRACEVELTG